MKKKKWRNRKGAGLLALALTLALALSGTGAFDSQAAIAVDVDRECDLDVSTKELQEMAEDAYTDAQVKVKLYRVASINESGDYYTVDGFQSLHDGLSNISDSTTAAEWETMAQDAQKIVEDSKIVAAETSTAENGIVSFKGIETGLYLVETESIVTDNYIYNFKPYLVSLPNNFYSSSGSGDDNWYYELTEEKNSAMGLKPEEVVRYGDLQIRKDLKDMNSMPGDKATFVFQIDITTPKGKTEQRIEAVTFDGKTGSEFATLRRIPAGSTVKVTEIYSGAGYELADGFSQPAPVTIVAKDDASPNAEVVMVTFENQPSGTTTGGYGIRNNFAKGDDGLYQYTGENNTVSSDTAAE